MMLLNDIPITTVTADNPTESPSSTEAALSTSLHIRDSLTLPTDTPTAVITAEELFGTASTLAPETCPEALSPRIYEWAPFQGIVLGLVFIYLSLLYHRLREIRILCRKPSFKRAEQSHMTDIQGTSYLRFLRTTTAIGLVLAALLTLRCLDRWWPVLRTIPDKWLPLLGVGTTLLLAAILLFQTGLLRIVGYVALSRPITDRLVALKINYLSLWVVFLLPAATLSLLAPDRTGTPLLWGVLILSGGILFLCLKESLRLFLAKKISILHWFLYLCIVEFFPASLVWLAWVRMC